MSAKDVVPVVVVGSFTDEHATRVTNYLSPGNWTLIDTADLAQRRYRLDHDGLWLSAPAGSASGSRDLIMRLGAGSRGWLRRVAPPGWQRGVVLGSQESAVKTSWLTLLTAFIRSSGVEWLTDLDALNRAENKLAQYRTALTLGIPTPHTVVVSDRLSLPPNLSRQVVVKPLGPGHFTDEMGEGRVVFASDIASNDPRLDELPGAPFIIQELIEAETHLRVVTVADDVWTCAVSADDVPFDWRRRSAAQRSFRPTAPPDEVVGGARRICEHFQLGYSSQDWTIDRSGRSWFLDLNPSGQWLFLPEPVASAIANAIAAWLTGAEAT